MNPTLENYQAAASQLGLVMPSMWYIVGALLFSTIGIFVFRLGRKTKNTYLTALGVVLVVYTYAVTNAAMVFLIGVCLCIASWAAHVSDQDED